MRRATIRRALTPAALVVLLAAGCDSKVGPEPIPAYDPRDSLERLDQVLDRLDDADDLLLALALVTAELFAEPAGDRPIMALAALGLPPRPEAPGAGIRAIARRGAVAARADIQPQVTFPPTLRGSTMVWDPVDGYVIDPDRADAPVAGVRLDRYRMDAATGLPRSPLQAIGYIDLIGQSRSLSDRIAIVSVDQTGTTDRVVADYYVDAIAAGTASAGSFRWSAVGSVGSGVSTISFDVVQAFAWSQAENRDELLTEYRYEVPGGAVHLEIEGESPFDAVDWHDLWFLARFDPGQARGAEMDVYIAPDGVLTGVFRKDGEDVIRVSGTDGSPHFERTDARGLTSAARAALNGIWDGTSDLAILTEWVIYPGYLLLAFGG